MEYGKLNAVFPLAGGWSLTAREDQNCKQEVISMATAIRLNFLTLKAVITLFFISIFIIFTVYNSSEDLRVRHFLAVNNRLT